MIAYLPTVGLALCAILFFGNYRVAAITLLIILCFIDN
jgi:hypothetical protein